MYDYYDLFGIEINASNESIQEHLTVIRRKERKRCDLFPPDSEEAIVSMQNLAFLDEAKTIFSDKEKRAEYDKQLAEYKAKKSVTQEEPKIDYAQITAENLESDIIDLQQKLYRYDKAEQARHIIEDMLEDGIRDPRLYCMLANSIFQSWKKNSTNYSYVNNMKAIEKVKEGLNYFPANIQLLTLAAELYVDANEFLNAIPYIKKALLIAPTHGGAIGWDIAVDFLMGNDLNVAKRISRYKVSYGNDKSFREAILKGFEKRVEFCYEYNNECETGFISCQQDYDAISDMIEYLEKHFPGLYNKNKVAQVRADGDNSWGAFLGYRFNNTMAPFTLAWNLIGLVIFAIYALLIPRVGTTLFMFVLCFCLIPLLCVFYFNKKPVWQFKYEDITGRGDVWKHILVGLSDANIIGPVGRVIGTFIKYSVKFSLKLIEFIFRGFSGRW